MIWRSKRGYDGLGLAALFAMVFILPVLHIIPLGTVAAERYLYVPLFGVGLGITIIACRLVHRTPSYQRIATFAAISTLLTMGIHSHVRSHDWSDEVSLWSAEIASQPQQFKAYANLGSAYAERREWADASRAFYAAWAIKPGHQIIFRNLVRLESIRLPPSFRPIYLNILTQPQPDQHRLRDLVRTLERSGFKSAAQLAAKKLR